MERLHSRHSDLSHDGKVQELDNCLHSVRSEITLATSKWSSLWFNVWNHSSRINVDTRNSTICHYHHVSIPGTEAEQNFDYNHVLDQLSTEMERARKHCALYFTPGTVHSAVWSAAAGESALSLPQKSGQAESTTGPRLAFFGPAVTHNVTEVPRRLSTAPVTASPTSLDSAVLQKLHDSWRELVSTIRNPQIKSSKHFQLRHKHRQWVRYRSGGAWGVRGGSLDKTDPPTACFREVLTLQVHPWTGQTRRCEAFMWGSQLDKEFLIFLFSVFLSYRWWFSAVTLLKDKKWR